MNNTEEFFKPKKTLTKKVSIEKKIPETKNKNFKFPLKRMVSGALIIIFLGLIGATGYFYWQYRKATNNPNVVAQDEVKNITEKISKFMELPAEGAILATVADKEKLKDQVFFSNAQNGDKVLIFSKAQKAILFRPSTGRVIETSSLSNSVAPVSSENTQDVNAPVTEQVTTPTQNETPVSNDQTSQEIKTEKIKVAIYNGTNTAGLANAIAQKISSLDNIEVANKTNAKGNYTKNIVIDLSGKNTDIVQKIAQVIGGDVEDLPEDEKKPDADILIIGGSK